MKNNFGVVHPPYIFLDKLEKITFFIFYREEIFPVVVIVKDTVVLWETIE